MSDLRDMCPKCGSQEKAWMERSPDGRSKCQGCSFEGKHTEWISPRRVVDKVEKLLTPPSWQAMRDEMFETAFKQRCFRVQYTDAAKQLQREDWNEAFDAAMQMMLEREAKLRGALEKYRDGRAFDYDRALRGEIHFNATLSAATAREALASFESEKEVGMSTKHTPGPWYLGEKDDRKNQIQTEYGWVIADVKRRSSGPRGLPEVLEKDEANARLIAAAPEMLEALKLCVKELEKIAGDAGYFAYGNARDVIVKATGGER